MALYTIQRKQGTLKLMLTNSTEAFYNVKKKIHISEVKHNSHFLLIGESIQLKEVQISWSSFSSCTTGCKKKKTKRKPWFLNSFNLLLPIYLIWPFDSDFWLYRWESLETTIKKRTNIHKVNIVSILRAHSIIRKCWIFFIHKNLNLSNKLF